MGFWTALVSIITSLIVVIICAVYTFLVYRRPYMLYDDIK